MTLFWVESGARTHDTRNHNPMLCQLSYDHHARTAFALQIGDWKLDNSPKAGAKVLLFFEICKFFSLFLQKIFIYGKKVVSLRAFCIRAHAYACECA